MNTLREAAQQALEALEDMLGWQSLAPQTIQGAAKRRAAALRAALATGDNLSPTEPMQEPIGVIRTLVQIHADGTETWREEPVWNAPPQRKPLTREEAIALWADKSDGPSVREIVSFARAVERAHGITGETA